MNLSVDRGSRSLGFLLFILLVRTPVVLFFGVLIGCGIVLAAALAILGITILVVIAPLPASSYAFVVVWREARARRQAVSEKVANSAQYCNCKDFFTALAVAVFVAPIALFVTSVKAVVLTYSIVEYVVHQSLYLISVVTLGPIILAACWSGRPCCWTRCCSTQYGCNCQRAEERDSPRRPHSGAAQMPRVFDEFRKVLAAEMVMQDGGDHEHLNHLTNRTNGADRDMWMLASTYCSNRRSTAVRAAVRRKWRDVEIDTPLGAREAEGEGEPDGAGLSAVAAAASDNRRGDGDDVALAPPQERTKAKEGASLPGDNGTRSRRSSNSFNKAKLKLGATFEFASGGKQRELLMKQMETDEVIFSQLQTRLNLDERNARLRIGSTSFKHLRECISREAALTRKHNRTPIADIVREELESDSLTGADTLLMQKIAQLFVPRHEAGGDDNDDELKLKIAIPVINTAPTSPGVESLRGACGIASYDRAALTQRMVLAFIRVQEVGDALVVKRLIEAGADARVLTLPYFLGKQWSPSSWRLAMQNSGFDSRFTMFNDKTPTPPSISACLDMRRQRLGTRGTRRQIKQVRGAHKIRAGAVVHRHRCVEPDVIGWTWREEHGPLSPRLGNEGETEVVDLTEEEMVDRITFEVHAQTRAVSPLALIFAMGTMRNALHGDVYNMHESEKRLYGRGIPLESSTLFALLSVVLAEIPEALEHPLCYFNLDVNVLETLEHETAAQRAKPRRFAERFAELDAKYWGLRERSRWMRPRSERSARGDLSLTLTESQSLIRDDSKWEVFGRMCAQFETDAAAEREATREATSEALSEARSDTMRDASAAATPQDRVEDGDASGVGGRRAIVLGGAEEVARPVQAAEAKAEAEARAQAQAHAREEARAAAQERNRAFESKKRAKREAAQLAEAEEEARERAAEREREARLAAATAEEERLAILEERKEAERRSRDAKIKRNYNTKRREANAIAFAQSEELTEREERAAETCSKIAAATAEFEAAESARRAEEELTGSAGAFDRYRVGAQLARGLSQADVDDFEELL